MDTRQMQRCNAIIKSKKIENIDLTGYLHHISLPVFPNILTKLVNEGVGFDGSSYGFSKVENSDMILVPDLSTAVIDPFRVQPTLSFYANILLTDQQRSPFSQDGRQLARRAEETLKRTLGVDSSWW